MQLSSRHPPPTRAFSLLLAALSFTAEADGGGDENAHLSDLPVVLTATRLAQAPADAPGAVTVIDQAMIRASGARNIHELFRLVPGFQVGMHSGNQPLVAYHGLSDDAPRRLLVQVDGRSVYSPYLIAGVEWNQIGVDIDDIERIEVFRGSNSAAYGSNAFLGVANIVTRSPSETLGTAVRYRAGSDGINDIGVRIGQQIPWSSWFDAQSSARELTGRCYQHLEQLRKGLPGRFKTESAIARPEDRALLKRELHKAECLGRTADGKVIYLWQRNGQEDAPLLRDASGAALSAADVESMLTCAALDAGLAGAAGISAEALRHTGIAWLVRQGLRFSELAGLVGRPSAEALASYADLAPDGPKRGLAEIEPLMPALRHG